MLKNPEPELDMFFRSDTTTVYLLHFARPIGRAQHYIGSTDNLDQRLQQHRRKWPLYRIDDLALTVLWKILPGAMLDALAPLHGRNFRRKHTFLQAIHKATYQDAFDLELLKACKRHRSNGLVMKVNQLKISWCVARTWQADRAFEMYLKRQHNAKRFCPVCHHTTPPEEPLPF